MAKKTRRIWQAGAQISPFQSKGRARNLTAGPIFRAVNALVTPECQC